MTDRTPAPGRSPPGFRFNRKDAAVLAGTAALTAGLWHATGGASLWLDVVVGHFFLFCNVFRVRRRLELLWAALLVLNAGVWLALDSCRLPAVLACQAPVTVLVLGMELASPQYRGVGWQRRQRRKESP